MGVGMEIRFNVCTELIKRQDGAIIIIKSSLPFLVGDGVAEEKINAFYTRLKEIHRSKTRDAFDKAEVGGFCRLDISAELNCTDGIVHVARSYTFSKGDKRGDAVTVDDFFLAADGRLIKGRKNGKKQTFLPSWKKKNRLFSIQNKNSERKAQ